MVEWHNDSLYHLLWNYNSSNMYIISYVLWFVPPYVIIFCIITTKWTIKFPGAADYNYTDKSRDWLLVSYWSLHTVRVCVYWLCLCVCVRVCVHVCMHMCVRLCVWPLMYVYIYCIVYVCVKILCIVYICMCTAWLHLSIMRILGDRWHDWTD